MKKQNRLITLTTKEHYNKYKLLCEGYKQEDLIKLCFGLYKNKEELQNKFNEDIYLNNLDMREIDRRFKEVMYFLRDKIRFKEGDKTFLYLSIAESCSFLKHILIYRILEIKPYFEEDILNFKDLYKTWFSLPDKIKYPKTKNYCLDMWFLDNKNKWNLKEVKNE